MLKEIENTETELDRLIQRIHELSDGKINTISILAYWNKEKKVHIEFFEGEGLDMIKNSNGDWELLESSNSNWKSIARSLSIEKILK